MRKITLDAVGVGERFEFNRVIYLRGNTRNSSMVQCSVLNGNNRPLHDRGYIEDFDRFEKVNLHWWEVLEIPTRIEIMQAHEDGAEIEWISKSNNMKWSIIKCPMWDWYSDNYRVKK